MGDKSTMNSNNLKNKWVFDNHVTIYEGIPEHLYSDAEIALLKERNPNVDVESFIGKRKKVEEKNLVVDVGKQAALNMLFRQPDISGIESLCFCRLGLGDGGYDFATDTRLFPELSDSSLGSAVGNPILITSFQPVAGDTLSGFTKVIAATFFSTNYQPGDFSVQNQQDFFVNESAIFNQNDEMFCRLSFANYPFDPVDNLALTVNWSIKVR